MTKMFFYQSRGSPYRPDLKRDKGGHSTSVNEKVLSLSRRGGEEAVFARVRALQALETGHGCERRRGVSKGVVSSHSTLNPLRTCLTYWS